MSLAAGTAADPGNTRPGALVFIAALPRELAMLSRDLGAVRVMERDGVLLQAGSAAQACPIILVAAGMGSHRSSLAVEAALAQGAASALLSVGLAGACHPLSAAGRAFSISLVVDSSSGERYVPDRCFQADPHTILATASRIAGPAEKKRLSAAYRADLVDMEAATVARLARAHGLPFGAIKAVSDEHDVDLTALSAFAGPRGEFRTGAFAAHTLLRPGTWRTAITLGRNSKAALASLTSAMHQLIVRHVSSLA